MSRISRSPWLLSAVLAFTLAADGRAQGQGGRGGYGDWRVTVDYDGRQMESILSLSRDQDGNRTGQWISFWGVNDLSDVQLENGDLKFAWTFQGFDNETHTSQFVGRIEEGALTGTLSGDRGDSSVKGTRTPRQPRAVGDWRLQFRIGDRDITTTLKITADAERNLAGQWISEWGEHKITEVSADRNQLTFKRTSTFEDRTFDSTFTGTLDRDGLTGTMSSEMGDVAVTGTRIGANAIGTWTLTVDSERGARTQRLRINRDLSALYGAIDVAAVTVDGNKLSFPMKLDFGDQPFEMSFAGVIDGESLSGELTTPRGTRKVTGAKRVWPGRNRGAQ